METSVRPNYRVTLFIGTVVILLLGAGVAVAWIFFLLPQSLGGGYSAALSTVYRIEQLLLGKKMVEIYVVTSLFIVLAVVVLHLLYSHRIAGPAFRLGREASAIGGGNLRGKIRLREKDRLASMADALSHATSRYQDRVAAAQEGLSRIEQQAEAIARLVQQGRGGDAVERAASELADRVRALEKDLSTIRT